MVSNWDADFDVASDLEHTNAACRAKENACERCEPMEREFWQTLVGKARPVDETANSVDLAEQPSKSVIGAPYQQIINGLQSAALETELLFAKIELLAATCSDWRQWLAWSTHRLEWQQRAPLALWCQHFDSRLTVGICEGNISECDRAMFEDRVLPGYYRQSREWPDQSGLTVVVYCHQPIVELSYLEVFRSQASRFLHQGNSIQSLAKKAANVEEELEARSWRQIAEFSAGAGHEINNPLGAIAGQAESLLANEYRPAARESLQRIRTQVARIHRMIRDLHFLAKPIVITDGSIKLQEIVGPSAMRAASKGSATFRLPAIPGWELVGNAGELRRAVEELLANAFFAAGNTGQVWLEFHRGINHFQIHVVDTGPGFSQLDREHAFTPFYSGRPAGRGLGMGLPVVRKIVEAHHGKLIVTHQRPTRVVLELPIPSAENQTARAA